MARCILLLIPVMHHVSTANFTFLVAMALERTDSSKNCRHHSPLSFGSHQIQIRKIQNGNIDFFQFILQKHEQDMDT